MKVLSIISNVPVSQDYEVRIKKLGNNVEMFYKVFYEYMSLIYEIWLKYGSKTPSIPPDKSHHESKDKDQICLGHIIAASPKPDIFTEKLKEQKKMKTKQNKITHQRPELN